MRFLFMGILERENVPKEATKCSAAQGPHSEVVCRALSADVCRKVVTIAKGSFAKRLRGKTVVTWNMLFIRNN